jgi:hypothetical protein
VRVNVKPYALLSALAEISLDIIGIILLWQQHNGCERYVVRVNVKLYFAIELTCLEDSLRSVRKSSQTWWNVISLRPCYIGIVEL